MISCPYCSPPPPAPSPAPPAFCPCNKVPHYEHLAEPLIVQLRQAVCMGPVAAALRTLLGAGCSMAPSSAPSRDKCSKSPATTLLRTATPCAATPVAGSLCPPRAAGATAPPAKCWTSPGTATCRYGNSPPRARSEPRRYMALHHLVHPRHLHLRVQKPCCSGTEPLRKCDSISPLCITNQVRYE